jgi:uncharacterized membrane protein
MNFVWIHLDVSSDSDRNQRLAVEYQYVDPFPFQFMTLKLSLKRFSPPPLLRISQNARVDLEIVEIISTLQINLLAEQENSKMLTMLKKSSSWITRELPIQSLRYTFWKKRQ